MPSEENTSSDSSSIELKKLIFFREGVKHEYNLLGQRISWYVTCQSFLVTAFTIAMGNPIIYFRFSFSILLPVLGITTSLLTKPSITGAILSAGIWKEKADKLVENEQLRDYDLNRKEIKTRGDKQEVRDKTHEESLRFVKLLPTLFVSTWIIFLIFGSIINVIELNKGDQGNLSSRVLLQSKLEQ